MNTHKIFDKNGQGFTRIYLSDNVEKVNPIEYYKSFVFKKKVTEIRDLLNTLNPVLTSQLNDDFFLKKAEETLKGFFEKFEQTEVPRNFLTLLETERKKDQIKLLKGQTLNSAQLMSLIFKSYLDYGYLYSRYVFENLPNGFENKKLPKLYHIKEDRTIFKVGETNLTDGQLKHIISHNKVIIAHFFEKNNVWHCIFNTYASLAGRENYKNGQAHFHYISNSFLLTKQEFIDSIKSGHYISTSVHIDLLDYGH